MERPALTGYRRPDGRFGIRNHVIVIPTSVCAAHAAERVARETGCIHLANQHGCCQLGDDLAATKRVLVGFGANPNVAASVVISLGCETVALDDIVAGIRASGKRCEGICIQQSGGEANAVRQGVEIIRKMMAEAEKLEREPMDISEITLALECGGSDTTSGLCSNLAIGLVSDRLVGLGGASILSETTEFIGAEHILARRGVTPEVRQKIIDIVADCENNIRRTGVDMRGSQPTPGNIEGGLTTIEEKSLGCIHKAGRTAPVQSVVAYAQAPAGKGLHIMDTPGQDVESITGMVAGGAQLAIFTTGRGTPTGCPIAPVIKITGNPQTARSMAGHIDVNAGVIIDGAATLPEVGDTLYDEMIAVINGKLTKAELLEHREFGIYRLSITI